MMGGSRSSPDESDKTCTLGFVTASLRSLNCERSCEEANNWLSTARKSLTCCDDQGRSDVIRIGPAWHGS